MLGGLARGLLGAVGLPVRCASWLQLARRRLPLDVFANLELYTALTRHPQIHQWLISAHAPHRKTTKVTFVCFCHNILLESLRPPPHPPPPTPCSGALELVGAVSAGLASSAGVVYVPQPRREGRTLALAPPEAAAGAAAAAAVGAADGAASAADAPPPPAVVSAARLMQHPALLAHSIDNGGSTRLGRYQAHTALAAAAILQGAEGLRTAHFAAGFALQQPVLLVAEAAVVLFASGGLEAVLVLPLAHTGESSCAACLQLTEHETCRKESCMSTPTRTDRCFPSHLCRG